MKPGRDVQGGDSMNLGCDVQDASDRPVLPGDSGLSAISAHRAMAISLLVQEMRCEARVTGSVHVGVSSSHISEPLHPLAVARTAGRELAGSTTAWNDALELLAPPEAVLHVTVWSQAAASQCVLVASRDVRLRGLDTEDGGFADERISLFNDRGAKVWLRLAASRRRCDIDLMCRGLRPTSPWVQLSPIRAPAHVQDEPNDLAAPHSERRNGSSPRASVAARPQARPVRMFMTGPVDGGEVLAHRYKAVWGIATGSCQATGDDEDTKDTGDAGMLKPVNAPQRKNFALKPSAICVSEFDAASICHAIHQFPLDVLRARGRILVGARAPFNVTRVDNAAVAMLGTRAEAVGRSVAVMALEHSDRLRLLEACDHASGAGWREHRRAVLAVDKSLLFVVQNILGTSAQATALEMLVFRPGPQHMAPILPLLGIESLLLGCGKRLEQDREAMDHEALPKFEQSDIVLDASDNLGDLECSNHMYSLAFPSSSPHDGEAVLHERRDGGNDLQSGEPRRTRAWTRGGGRGGVGVNRLGTAGCQ